MSRTESEIDELHTDTEIEYTLPSCGEEEYEEYEPEEPFRYRTEDFISRPIFSHHCDIEENILEFDHSYGYDNMKPYNLIAADENTIVYISGNLIHFFDVNTKDVWFRRSAFGGGIGHFAKNPNPDFPHIAIGENGNRPPIIIYEWPSMEIMCVLKDGAARKISHLHYSPDGKLLASQSGEPDYLITIFNWPKSMILLRSKSYVNDVYRVMFSPDVPGHLTTCGVAHIKFWKMASTFTGLKLQGEVGRFGKTEYSDIIGIYQMPDEKVISGCYWGNILVWDEGLIKLEVCRKGRKRCHDGEIVQFDYVNGELWTVSTDGRVRMWYYDTIDQADPPDEDRFLEMEPTYDFYTPGAAFMCIVKQYKDPENSFYFAQDARGGIFRIDLTIETDAEPSEQLLRTHAGIAKALAVCPWGPYFSSLGIGGKYHLYNYVDRKLLAVILFPAKGSALLWVPIHIDPSGEVAILGFEDGTVRVGVWKIVDKPDQSVFHIIQIIKGHNKPITAISLNPTGSVLVSGGEDSTIFVYQITRHRSEYMKLVAIGYIITPGIVSCLTWHKTWEDTIIIGCTRGEFMTVQVPTYPVDYTTITYVLDVEPITQNFMSGYKSHIRREIELKKIAVIKAAKRAKKMEELAKFKRDNPGIDVDEEIFLADSESEEKLEPLYVPTTPNPIIWIEHTEDDTLWLSMGGYDAGYIYEYNIGQVENEPVRSTMVHGADDVELTCYCYDEAQEYIIFAMQDGSIRVNKRNPNNWRDLSNWWQLAMHDNYNGFVHGLSFSHDEGYFISCGHDGNLFTFRFYPDYSSDDETLKGPVRRIIPDKSALIPIKNEDYYEVLSVEETIVKAEVDRINKVANENKAEYLEKLQKLREKFELILERNAELPESQQISQEELLLDSRVDDNLQEKLSADIALVKRQLAFLVEKSQLRMMKLKKHFINCMDIYPINVTAIRTKDIINGIKQRRLDDNFFEILKEVDKKIAESELKGRPPERAPPPPAKFIPTVEDDNKLEYFLVGLSKEVIENKFGAKIHRLLAKYRQRKDNKVERSREWEIFKASKPSDLPTDEEDEIILAHAEETIGDFKLKSDPRYKVPKHLRESTFKKFKELLLVRQKQYEIAHNFNIQLSDIRHKKKEVHEYLKDMTKLLEELHEEIMESDRQYGPDIFEFGAKDYPEHDLEVNVKTPEQEVQTEKVKPLVKQPNLDTLQREVLQSIEEVETEEDEEISVWELEMKAHHYRAKLFAQEETIHLMDTSIDNYDAMLRFKRMGRISVITAWYLITLHLLTLNQELLILKDCEDKEDNLQEKVNEKIVDLMDLKDISSDISSRTDLLNKDVIKLQEKEKELQKTFLTATSENKFFDFLRRIFKKKYKPPKLSTDDDSDSSSSSSSSEEEDEADAASIDSKDFGIIRLDESVCPKGCDPNIYDLTFQLRSQRHTVESDIKECYRQIDILKKEAELNGKKTRILDLDLKKVQDDLETFQREKQQKLNKINCTIVLNLHQIQNLNEQGQMNLIKDSIVFSKSMMSHLFKRVGELKMETLQQQSKHKLSVTHLTRMKTDLKYMKKEIETLNEKINERMKIKFGGPVDVNELEEYMLKKQIFDLKLSMYDFRNMFNAEMKHWYEILRLRQKEIIKIFRSNTSKMELLTMLHIERKDLSKVINRQEYLRSKMDSIMDEAQHLKDGIKKLNVVVQDQNKEIETLKREIKIFRSKGYALPAETRQDEQKVEEEAEEDASAVSEWAYLDDYMYTETYAKQYWANKEMHEAARTKHEVIMSIMEELFKNLKVELTTHTIESILKSTISNVMNKCDIEQIISDLLSAIPVSPSGDEQSLIESTAEKLSNIDNAIEIDVCSKEIFIQIIDDVLKKNIEDPNELVTNVIITLIENLPLHCILDEENIKVVCDKLKSARVDLTDEDLLENISADIKMRTMEARTVLTEILERVYTIENRQVPDLMPWCKCPRRDD